MPAARAKRRISSARRSSGSIDRVDDQLGGQVEDVDVGRVLLALGGDEGLALGLVVDRLDLVVEDGVDRRLRAHHGDRGARQGDAAVGLEGRPGHRVEAGAVGLADDHAELGDGRLGDGADHLGAVADDPLALDRGADHEARHVGEEEQRDVEGVAGLDEAGGLVGRVDEEDAAFLLGLVGDDADRRARRGGRSRRSALSPSACGPRGRSRRRAARRAPRACRRAGSRRRGRSRRSAPSRPAPRARPPAAPRASCPACRRGSAWRGRSPPRRS